MQQSYNTRAHNNSNSNWLGKVVNGNWNSEFIFRTYVQIEWEHA